MKWYNILFLVCCVSLCCSGFALAQDVELEVVSDGGVTLSWNPNSESDLDGYKIHSGKTPGNYDTVIDVKNVTQYTVTGLTVGETYFFAVTAYDTWKNESGYSEEVGTDAKDVVVPKQPTGLKEVTTNINNLQEGFNDVADEQAG